MPSEQNPLSAPPAGPLLIDGVPAATVVAPTDAAAVAELLADAAHLGQSVIPVGGGTALALGNPPRAADIALSTSNLGGIIDYEPFDLVVSAGAGAKLGDVQAVLAEHGQTLPIDPPGGDDATIGGLIATALTGPLRLSAGSLRDLLIGIAMAHPSGTLTKAGGMVVKNVSGFDLPRVYHGSLGTLGVVVSANFKVLPLPRTEATMLARFSTLDAAVRAAAAIRQQVANSAAIESGWLNGAWFVAVRFTGREPSVKNGLAQAAALLTTETATLDRAESAAWWKLYQAACRLSVSEHDVLVRCTVRPRETVALALGLHAELPALGATAVFFGASTGLGSVILRARLAEGSADRLAELQTVLFGLASNVTILAAPPAWKRGLDVWGRTPETIDLMRSLKEQFDPHGVLNPGRFAGFI